uniref:Uncharacterized protein n=1 Tax=Globisporangium ultimum (strain ATCC 200006 / CBS 805.95 / DAOM BR144) TaxID=431595 RepID=K3W718_GLOUD
MAADSSLDDVLRLLTKKKKTQGHGSSGVSSSSKGTKKRQRSGSVSSKDAAGVDPLKRLEAFRERMFDPTLQVNTHAKTSHANPEDAVLLAKWKPSKDGSSSKKKRKTAAFGTGGVDGDDDDDDADMPRVTVKAARSSDKSEKKVKKKEKKESAKSKVVKIPGQSGSIAALTLSSQHKLNSHQLKKEPQAASVKVLPKKRVDANTKSTLGSSLEKPKLNAVMQEDPTASLEDPLEKALQSVKEQLQTRKSKDDDDGDENEGAVDANEAVQQKEKKNRRRKKKSKRQEAAEPSASSDPAAEPKEEEAGAVIKEVDTASALAVEEVVKVVVAAQQEAPRPLKPTKSDQSADTSLTARDKKEMKKKRYAPMNVSVMLANEPSKKSPVKKKEAIKDDQTVAKPSPPLTTTSKQTLVVETIKEDQQVAKLTETLEQQDRPPCFTSTTSESVVESDSDITGSIVQKDEQPPKPVQRKRLIRGSDTKPTVSAAAAAAAEKKKEGVSDTLPPALSAATAVAPSSPSKRQKRAKVVHEPPAKPAATKATLGAVTKSQKKKPKIEEPPQFIKEEVDDDMDDSGGERGAEALSHDQKEIFSSLIDEAARQQWELVEVGRLVKLFAGQWGHKIAKTARFLRRYCPELVNVDFLEGLDAKLRPEQIVKIFDRGSGNTTVLMNKIASAVENGHVNVSDVAVLDMLASKMQPMATNHDVLEFLHPLLESVSTVRDVSRVLKHVCAHWHVDRTMTLVQQILLTSVFDDLDGNQDEILQDLPELAGKLDFPSRLDQEDADENGNLIGLIANEDSDLGEDDEQEVDAEYEAAEDALGEIHSDHEDSEESDEDDEEYEGETDSEEERKAMVVMSGQWQPRRRSRFILDEADEDDEKESELETEEDDDDDDEEEDEADFGKGGKGTEHGGRRQRVAKTTTTKAADSSESESSDETWRSKPKASQ